jgi:hypothetical protein
VELVEQQCDHARAGLPGGSPLVFGRRDRLEWSGRGTRWTPKLHRIELLDDAVLDDFEVLRPEIEYRPALPISDDSIDLNDARNGLGGG